MPYDIKWLEEPHVIDLVLFDSVSDEELAEMLETAAGMMEGPVAERANVLIDVTNLKKMPTLPVLKRELDRFTAHFGNQRAGISAVYGLSPFTRYIFELLMKVSNARFKTFESRGAAQAFVWQMIQIDRPNWQSEAGQQAAGQQPDGEEAAE